MNRPKAGTVVESKLMLVGRVKKSEYAPAGYALDQNLEHIEMIQDDQDGVQWMRGEHSATPVRVRVRITVVKDQSGLEAQDD